MNNREKKFCMVLFLGLAAGVIISCDEEGPPAGPKIPATILYKEDFEGPTPFSTVYSKEIGDWDYALQYVSSPVYQGSVSARFEIREDQPLIADGKRSEVVIVKESQGLITKNTWYSFAVYFPADSFVLDHSHDVISQWIKDGSPTRLLTEDDRFLLDVGNMKGNKEQIFIDDVTKNTWHQFVFHFIHSPGSDGLIQVWHNGKRKINRLGGNMYLEDLPKWKIGIKKSAYEVPGTADSKVRVVFFDNVKVTDENGSYDELAPSNF